MTLYEIKPNLTSLELIGMLTDSDSTREYSVQRFDPRNSVLNAKSDEKNGMLQVIFYKGKKFFIEIKQDKKTEQLTIAMTRCGNSNDNESLETHDFTEDA